MFPRREILFSLAFIAIIVSGAAAQEWGDLTVRFNVDGSVPPPAELAVTKDVEVCSKHRPRNEEVVVGKDGGLANVVVFLYAGDGVTAINPAYEATADATVEIDNASCAFVPHIALLRTSQTLVVKNSDTVGHNSNITCFSNASKNILVPSSGEVQLKFTSPERLPMTVTCSIHPWMKAYLLIQDHPYMAVSSDDGALTIKGLPAGEHQFVFWHEKLRYLRDLQIGGGSTDRRGRLSVSIKPGNNDLGTVSIKSQAFAVAD